MARCRRRFSLVVVCTVLSMGLAHADDEAETKAALHSGLTCESDLTTHRSVTTADGELQKLLQEARDFAKRLDAAIRKLDAVDSSQTGLQSVGGWTAPSSTPQIGSGACCSRRSMLPDLAAAACSSPVLSCPQVFSTELAARLAFLALARHTAKFRDWASCFNA